MRGRNEEPPRRRKGPPEPPPRRGPAHGGPPVLEAKRPPASARMLALDVLEAVLGPRRQPLEEAFASHPDLARLALRDRQLARLLVATALRRTGELDALAAPFLRFTPEPPRLRHILRLGIAQLAFLGTPPHAAVHTTVELARHGHEKAVPMINAILRRVASHAAERLPQLDGPRLDTPDWLWRSWVAAFGEPCARAIAEIHLREPPLDLVVRDEPSAAATRLEAELLWRDVVRRPVGGAIETLPGYAEGAFWVQDVAATVPARLLGEVRDRPVLDLCAAPGGKTLQLAAAGARVTAVDISGDRLSRVRDNLARTRLSAELVEADATQWRPQAPFPLVLLDAPCSATGTIRRHPDIPHHKRPADIERMAALQDRLLDAAVAMLAPGGLLVYAVCSLQPEEGEERIRALLERTPALLRDPIGTDELAGLPVLRSQAGEIRTLPCHWAERGGMDGFFIARLRRAP
ncbi:MAG: methyltransferase domain-containing protein [Geminicoccaceae bacterium]|nr:methyltransferase domain-containing protein [Geminicoccaceae bacterium]MCX8099848.1 methyltransferase domain-containing protein [Geminicoccaceae bacterium]MDW8369738.1 RsmB/NOP family class I SAM-dependent RNA methyltransferase [Geminicoccaceae bacterium]